MAVMLANNAASLLAGPVDETQTEITVMAGHGGRFPSPTSGDWFPVTLETVSESNIVREILRCTSRTGDVLTVERAQEGTLAQTFPSGAAIELRLTKAALEEMTDFAGISIIGGNGLTGGGDLTQDRTLALGTPGTVNGTTSNAVTSESHTHAVSSTASRSSNSASSLLNAKAMYDHTRNGSGDHDGRYVQLDNGISEVGYVDATETMYVRQAGGSYTPGNPIFEARSGGGAVRFSVAHEAPALVGDPDGWDIAGRGAIVTSDRAINTGEHLTGGGNLGSNRTISLQISANNGIEDGQGYTRAFFGNDGNEWDNISFRSSFSGGGKFNLKRKDGTNTVRFDMWSGDMEIGNVPWARLTNHVSVTGNNGLTGGGSLNSNRSIGIANGGVTTARLANSAVTAQKLANGSSENGWVKQMIANGTGYNQVGTWKVEVWYPTDSSPSNGSNYSGNDIGISPSPGTWKCMGHTGGTRTNRGVYLWLRVN